MADIWTPLLNSLPLSRTERETIRRFRDDPAGRGFLPVADILRAHRLIDESLELLTQGVSQHPRFTVARVILVRELLGKGMVSEAWQTLEASPEPLRDNVLAQKLRLKLSVLMGEDAVVKATIQHLKLHQMHDSDSKRLAEQVELNGLAAAQTALLKDFSERGIDITLPATGKAIFHEVDTAPSLQSVADEPVVARALSAYFDPSEVVEDPAIAGFHVVPLDEIFRPGDSAGSRATSGGIELDSTTLAEIYVRQHHYSKALEIYRRLLRQSPGNDALRTKVSELIRLDKEQKDADLTLDPGLVDVIETVEIINKQMHFFNELLSRLQ